MWRKGKPGALFGGNVNGTASVENSMEVAQKIKNRTMIWSHFWVYIKGNKIIILKRYLHPYVHGGIIYNG